MIKSLWDFRIAVGRVIELVSIREIRVKKNPCFIRIQSVAKKILRPRCARRATLPK
jgi:hypothetical protein